MEFNQQFFWHAFYVALMFALLLWGALAYRQIIDNLSVRKIRLGEDLLILADGWGVVFLAGALVVWLAITVQCFVFMKPAIYTYAIPMVLLVQLVQIALRVYFQRTRIRTHGILIRPVFLERYKAVDYNDILAVRIAPHGPVTHLHLILPNGELQFRILSVYTARLERIIRASVKVPVYRRDRQIHD
ncbi:MAG: hypothetical protein OKBPIBMD_00811 [Chlorobi bacterium]|nr:MAG: hypothetical protein F9K28_07775 [Bacteroidota bacterium]KXK33404.1 MAG: hypothetical protein UZ06_CHB003001804 [Chlorobi bacterium OLB6]MBV6463385.1 hypothetical protein [Chlorobiota bacterium]MBW7853773.1 hypothetical protein [Candidatus Kapabacteria bacterium]MCC6332184.1 hypothetical protein [Ignavibacteria bacterium]